MNQLEFVIPMKQTYLFNELNDEEMRHILAISKVIEVRKNTSIFQEGEVEHDVYLIIKGKVEVLKRDEKSGISYQIATLGAGELVGEMALIDFSPRSASVRSIEDTKFLTLPLARLSALAEHKPIYMQIVHNISKQLTQRLRKTNDFTLKVLQSDIEGTKIRLEMERFLFVTLIVLAAWIFVSSIVSRYTDQIQNTGIISSPVIFIIFLACCYQVKRSAYPISFYGLTLDRWMKNALEAIVFSLPILVLAVALKYFLIQWIPALQNETVFSFTSNSPDHFIFPTIYILFTPLQELIARGCFQSSIHASLTGPHKTLWSIILSSLLFSAFHAFVSAEFALAAFISGLFWGWLYARQGSLVGCSVSHALIGGWCLSALGFQSILRL